MRLLSYNIRYGGAGRVGALAAVVSRLSPDLVVLQEATRPDVVKGLAEATGMSVFGSRENESVGFLSRVPIASHRWHRPAGSRHGFLEIVPAQTEFRVFGVHLSAVHSNWTERRRVRELRAVLEGIREHQHGFHVVMGDFNTLAPGETLDIRKLPPRLQAVVWVTGRKIRWETIQVMLDASYVDGYRALHPDPPGYTFPTWDPHVRLDYAFVPYASRERLQACDVQAVDEGIKAASDHMPLVVELDVGASARPA